MKTSNTKKTLTSTADFISVGGLAFDELGNEDIVRIEYESAKEAEFFEHLEENFYGDLEKVPGFIEQSDIEPACYKQKLEAGFTTVGRPKIAWVLYEQYDNSLRRKSISIENSCSSNPWPKVPEIPSLEIIPRAFKRLKEEAKFLNKRNQT